MPKAKYIFSDHEDNLIRQCYRLEGTGNGEVSALAEYLGMPRWRVSRRAREIGAVEVRVKEPVWSDEELKILEHHAHKNPEVIRRHLKAKGYRRSTQGVILKRKRMRYLQNLDGYSAHSLAECFGVDAKVITRWIERGHLQAKRRGTDRSASQGGDMWWIKPNHIRQFIIDSVGLIDFRKVDKFWLVDILTGRGYDS